MNRKQKIEYLEGVKTGKIKLKRHYVGRFKVQEDGSVLLPDNSIVDMNEAKKIAQEYEVAIFITYTTSQE